MDLSSQIRLARLVQGLYSQDHCLRAEKWDLEGEDREEREDRERKRRGRRKRPVLTQT